MDIGIDSFAALLPDSATGALRSGAERMGELIEEVEVADQVGLDVFGIGEHHRAEFLDSAPTLILAAAAARTTRIRLTSAVTVLSAIDPVRAFEQFATLDLISQGRAEIVAGRGSFGEAFPLFGLDPRNYDELFAENLDLLLTLRETAYPTWEGRFRAPLTGQGVFPRPVQDRIPIWLGVGGTPESFGRAGLMGLPLMVAIIGGSFDRFRPLVDLYREAGRRAGHDPATLKVGVHAVGFVDETDRAAADAMFPGWAHLTGKVGRERGWSAPTRAQFDALIGPEGALLVGSPETVAAKVVQARDSLGGLDRLTFQMTTAAVESAVMKRAITLIGAEVAPRVRAAVAAA